MEGSNGKSILPSILVIVVLGAVIYLAWPKGRNDSLEPVACTMEAKICPDGTAVGRVGPNCEFAPCSNENSNLINFTDPKTGATFQFSENIGAKFISKVDWPPSLQILDESFSCIEAGSEVSSSGKTSKETINGREYCITRESEGAAGSIYTMYAYAFPKEDGVAILTFSLRFPQCANYDDPRKTECENERVNFNVGNIVDQIAESLKLK